MTSVLSRIGVGVVLAWLALPLLAWVARRGRAVNPASRHRALVGALVLSALLLGVPGSARLWTRVFGDTCKSSRPSSRREAWTPPRHGPRRMDEGPCRRRSLLVRCCVDSSRRSSPRLDGDARSPRSPHSRACLRTHGISPGLVGRRGTGGGHYRARAPRLRRGESSVRGPGVPPNHRGVKETAETADPETMALILRHELEHVSRRDVAVDVAVTTLLTLFSVHPTARALAREIRFARESAVDATVAPRVPMPTPRCWSLWPNASTMRRRWWRWMSDPRRSRPSDSRGSLEAAARGEGCAHPFCVRPLGMFRGSARPLHRAMRNRP